MVFGVPLTKALTFLKLGFQVLFDLLWEWLTLIPNTMLFPQTSHFAIYRTPPVCLKRNKHNVNFTYFLLDFPKDSNKQKLLYQIIVLNASVF